MLYNYKLSNNSLWNNKNNFKMSFSKHQYYQFTSKSASRYRNFEIFCQTLMTQPHHKLIHCSRLRGNIKLAHVMAYRPTEILT